MPQPVIGHHYQIPSRNGIFLVIKGQNGTPILKDLNRSRAWVVNDHTEGYFEGYRVKEGKLVFVQSDIIYGKYHERNYNCRPDIELDRIKPCGVEVKRIDLSEWGPNRK